MDVLSEIAATYSRAWDADAPADLIDTVMSPDVVDHNPSPGQGPGLTGIKQIMRLYHAAFPDLQFTQEDIIVTGDRAVVRWRARGTHEGDDFGIPATHRTVELTGIDILHIEDGKIVERWGEADSQGLRRQLA